MRPSKTKVTAYACNSLCLREIERMVLRGPRRDGWDLEWDRALERCYMCCEHIPLEEMNSHDPAECAEFFMLESRKHHWQIRQMQPLGHLDIIAVGRSLYMIYDKFTEDIDDYCEIPLPNTPNFILIKIKEDR